MDVDLSWHLLVALVLLVACVVLVIQLAGLGLSGEALIAAARAVGQLGTVSLLIVVALSHLIGAAAFVLVMFLVAVWTTGGRLGAHHASGWIALAIGGGVGPVLLIVFLTGTVPFNGAAIVPVCGIIIGNAMTAHTLLGQQAMESLRSGHGLFEASLALGFRRSSAIKAIIRPATRAALTPNLDQTRTVGSVTLPGAFVGVLMGGGSALQAGAAQILVLFAIMAAQVGTVVVGEQLICAVRILPRDLAARLHD